MAELVDAAQHGGRCVGGAQTSASFSQAATERGMPLRVETFATVSLHELYEKHHVLVRPGGHVAWRGDLLPEEPAQILDVERGAPHARVKESAAAV